MNEPLAVWLLAALVSGCSLFHNDGTALTVRTDKQQYHVGEEVTLHVVNRTKGSALFVFYSYKIDLDTNPDVNSHVHTASLEHPVRVRQAAPPAGEKIVIC